jgi:hypothetical protein
VPVGLYLAAEMLMLLLNMLLLLLLLKALGGARVVQTLAVICVPRRSSVFSRLPFGRLILDSFGPLIFRMPATPSDPDIVTRHAVYALTCLCKDEFLDALGAGATGEACCVVGFFACHDCLLDNGESADLAWVAALSTDGMSVWEDEDVVAISVDQVPALGTLKASSVPELCPGKHLA